MTFRANYRVTKQVLDWFTKLNKVYERSEQILRITRFLFKKGSEKYVFLMKVFSYEQIFVNCNKEMSTFAQFFFNLLHKSLDVKYCTKISISLLKLAKNCS